MTSLSQEKCHQLSSGGAVREALRARRGKMGNRKDVWGRRGGATVGRRGAASGFWERL